MSNQTWPIEISCDAPSYLIVQACERLGFQAPLDVRWCRMGNYLTGDSPAQRLLNFLFLNGQKTDKQTCFCRAPLPLLEDYAFTFACGKVVNYSLAQCPKCRTIFWDEGVAQAFDGSGSDAASQENTQGPAGF
jgi:hypothetical protein